MTIWTPVEGDVVSVTVQGTLSKDSNADYWTLEISPTARISFPGLYLRAEPLVHVTKISHTETDAEKITRLEAQLAAKP
jgi:hypothetical protein